MCAVKPLTMPLAAPSLRYGSHASPASALPVSPQARPPWTQEDGWQHEQGTAALSQADHPKVAYVTLITRDSYLPGVLALRRSLLTTNCRHPLLVMYAPDTLSAEATAVLSGEGCVMRPVRRFAPVGMHTHTYKLPIYAECWCKLRMWEWEEYDRLVYACALLQRQPSYFNAGMFVMAPSVAQLRALQEALLTGRCRVGGYAEQDALNWFFQGAWTPLSPRYNLQKGIRHHHPELWDPASAAILHYTDRKPWDRREEDADDVHADIVGLWWRIFEGCGSGGPPFTPGE